MHRLQRLVPLSVLAGLVAVLAGCGLGSNPDEEALDSFAAAVHTRDAAAGAALTTDPAHAKTALQASFDGMGKAEPTMTVGDKSDAGTYPTSTTWRIRNGATVTTEGSARVADGRIQWSPHVLDARLEPGGRLLYSDQLDYATPILDRNGTPLMTWQPVTLVTLRAGAPAASADAVAAAVHGPAPSVSGDGIRSAMAAQRGQDYTVVTLRADDIAPIHDRLAAIPGVVLSEQGRLLSESHATRSPAFDALPDVWLKTLKAHGGWSVAIRNPGGTVDVGGRPVTPVAPLNTTVDLTVQHAAQRAVDGVTRPAAIVALDPATGGVLAVAQNKAADAQGPIALTGLYPPGSTFKTITTSAALDAGVVGADDRVPCPGVATVAGRTIPNEDEFDLGTVPLHTAFAQSCNTTQAMLAAKLPEGALAETAASLGLGVDYMTPGLTTVTGKVPPSAAGAARVEAAIGQGTVVASPFGMAVVEASLAHGGALVHPSLLAGQPARADKSPQPLPAATVQSLRSMMRETVTSGTARSLKDIDGLGGKTGTAEVQGGPAHGWFVGIDEPSDPHAGRIAFATFIDGADSSAPAVQMAGTFLRQAQ